MPSRFGEIGGSGSLKHGQNVAINGRNKVDNAAC